jgi:hypothetical protein
MTEVSIKYMEGLKYYIKWENCPHQDNIIKGHFNTKKSAEAYCKTHNLNKMDYNEYAITPTPTVTNERYSDEIEFLVTQLNEMAHMAARYDRGVQLRKASHILRTLDEMRAKGKK